MAIPKTPKPRKNIISNINGQANQGVQPRAECEHAHRRLAHARRTSRNEIGSSEFPRQACAECREELPAILQYSDGRGEKKCSRDDYGRHS